MPLKPVIDSKGKWVFPAPVIALLISALLFAVTSHSLAQTASPPVLDVSRYSAAIALPEYISVWRGPKSIGTAPQTIIVPPSSDFLPLETNSVQFGYSSDEFWLKVRTVNNSEYSQELVLTTGVSFLEPLVIYTHDESGVINTLLTINENTPYNSRPLATPKITVPIRWQAGEAKTILLYAVSNSGISMQLALMPEDLLNADVRNLEITFAAITGILSTLILVNLFHFLAIRRLAHLFYAIQEIAVLLFLLHGEGLAFKYLWPDSPVWNAHATMIFGHLTNLSAGLFALYFLSLKRRAPHFFKMIFAVNCISAAMLLATAWIEPQVSNQVGLAVSGIGAILLFSAGVKVLLNGYMPARYYVAGWSFLAVATSLFFLANLGFISVPFAPILAIRVGILLEALLLSYALSDQLKDIDMRANKAQKELLLATQASYRDQKEKADLEHSRLIAEKALLEKEVAFAKERHDIRQPIYSLRLALLAGKKSDEKLEVEVFQRALDHMEQLLSDEEELSQAAPSAITTFGDLFTQLRQEFVSEAKKLNTEFSIVHSSVPITVPLLPLKRTLSNLLANAIRHSASNKILLGLRRRAAGVSLIVADNGVGMSDVSATKKGQGLGMQIIEELCNQQKWKLTCITIPQRGTVFRIDITC